MTLAPRRLPERVGRYDLLLPIASGGMATVYLAKTRGIGGFEREVALKLTHAHLRDKPSFADDLIEEAKLASRVRHPNVVPVLDVGDDACGIYLVMEYVEGDALSSLLHAAATEGDAGLPLPIAMRILVDALAGLHAAHELRDEAGRPVGLVHRDFSPQNILVDTTGRALLADFGVAKAATRAGQTITGFVKGKIAYMSPEQGRGLAIDRTCDVWAAGVIAWELVAGRRLWPPGEDESDRLVKVVSQVPPRVSTVVPGVPPALDEAIARALTMDARRRTPTAAALARELAEAASASFGLAHVDEVAETVRYLAGPKLEARRAQVAEVVGGRAPAEQEIAPTRADTIVLPIAPPPLAEGSSTDAVSTLQREAPARAATQRTLAAAVVAVALVGAAALLASRVLSGGAARTPDAGISAAAGVPTAVTATTEASVAPPAVSSEAMEAAEDEAAPPDDAAEPSASTSARPPRRAPPPAPRRARTRRPNLAPSPYEAKP